MTSQDEECKLLGGPAALSAQLLLIAVAIGALVYKRCVHSLRIYDACTQLQAGVGGDGSTVVKSCMHDP